MLHRLSRFDHLKFLAGLFSLIDAMLDKTMKELLRDLPLTQDTKIALVNESGPYAPVLKAVKYYEQSLREPCLHNLELAQVDHRSVGGLYLHAVEYDEQLLASC